MNRGCSQRLRPHPHTPVRHVASLRRRALLVSHRVESAARGRNPQRPDKREIQIFRVRAKNDVLYISKCLCTIIRRSMTSPDIVFKAIAHPARRQILSLLSQSTRSVKELTRAFDMSQPAISQHLSELRDANLVTSDKVGLEQKYRLTGEPLRLVFEWSGQYKRFFDPAGHAWSLASAPRVSTSAPVRRKASNGS